MRRRDHHRPDDDRSEDGRREDGQREDWERDDWISQWMPVMAALPFLLLGLLSAGVMLRREVTRPMVGDIVAFRPTAPDRDFWRVSVPALLLRDGAEARPCTLHSPTMARTGGTMVVIARMPTDPPRLVLDWVGDRTAEDAADCGGEGALVVNRVDLRKLATAAGGFGLKQRRADR